MAEERQDVVDLTSAQRELLAQVSSAQRERRRFSVKQNADARALESAGLVRRYGWNLYLTEFGKELGDG